MSAGRWRFPMWVGWRLALSTRRKGFLALISLIALGGMVLGVASLIVVLAVMNGFHGELRDRLLVMVPHWEVVPASGMLSDWTSVAADVRKRPHVRSVSPFVGGNVLLASAHNVRGVRLYGLQPDAEPDAAAHWYSPGPGLAPGRYRVMLGQVIARQLGVSIGDTVTVVRPAVAVTPAGLFPRVKRLTVAGLLQTGSQADAEYAVLHLADARRVFATGEAVHGLRVYLDSPTALGASEAGLRQALPPSLTLRSWRTLQGPLFDAVAMEKRMVGVLLFIVVLIAAFNIVAVLTLTVYRKRADIAILRAMGASRLSVLGIFIVQGMVLGGLGTGLGVLAGVGIAPNVGVWVARLERWLGSMVFDPGVFYVTTLPSVLQSGDVIRVAVGALLLSWLATVYPAWRASCIPPADVLRYQ